MRAEVTAGGVSIPQGSGPVAHQRNRARSLVLTNNVDQTAPVLVSVQPPRTIQRPEPTSRAPVRRSTCQPSGATFSMTTSRVRMTIA